MKEYKVTVRQFLTRTNPEYPHKKVVPFRIMFGIETQRTAKGVYMKLRAKPAPSRVCMKCNKTLEHPVSLLYGLGPECGKHFHENPMTDKELETFYERLKESMKEIRWEGWLPINHITIEETDKEVDESEYNWETAQPVEVQKQEEKQIIEEELDLETVGQMVNQLLKGLI